MLHVFHQAANYTSARTKIFLSDIHHLPFAIFGDHLFVRYLLAFLPVDHFLPQSKRFVTKCFDPKAFRGYLIFRALRACFCLQLET